MYRFDDVEINNDKLPTLFTHINFFQKRASDLVKFWRSVNWGTHSISVDRSDENAPKISGSLPKELELEGLYRRFRFLYHNNEKSNYFRILKLLSQSTRDPRFHAFCRQEKQSFYEEQSLEFAFITAQKKYKPEEIIDYWFNAYYFHDDENKIQELDALTDKIGEHGARIILYHTVHNCCIKVRNLNYLLSETSESNLVVKYPEEC
jgi:hypothetical protein